MGKGSSAGRVDLNRRSFVGFLGTLPFFGKVEPAAASLPKTVPTKLTAHARIIPNEITLRHAMTMTTCGVSFAWLHLEPVRRYPRYIRCEYCKTTTEQSGKNCRNCGAPVEC